MSAIAPSGSSHAKKATNVSIDDQLLAEARALRINISRAAEAGLASAIATRRAEQWREENQAALDSSNAWVELHGLPLAGYRKF